MKLPRSFGSHLLPLILVPLLQPRVTNATGIESPLRWIEQAEEPPLLKSPEFYFELEVRRLAAELHPDAKAKLPPTKDDERDYDKQTADGDVADFRDALAKKAINPPDPVKAEAAHQAVRDQLPGKNNAAALAEFPSEFADYHRGALAFRSDHDEDAQAAWKALLARPAAERRYRTTWAMFMLGKIAIKAEDWNEARTRFVQTRQAAKEGFADTLGLVAASFGWEAYANLHDKKYPEAARLYLEQLAAGDTSAVNSLRVVMGEVFSAEAELPTLASDSLLQRLGTAGAVAEMSPFEPGFSEAAKDDLITKWLHALEAAGAKNVRDADRVAWIAYKRGDYANAQRWLARAEAESPYVLWLKAKFSLRDGKLDAATKLLARAVEKLPLERRVEAYSIYPSSISPYDVARGEMGLLHLHRSEFIAALRMFLEGGLYSDAFYVADGVLTIDELKDFVAKEATNLPKVTDDAAAAAAVWHFYYYNDPARELRSILARRFIRTGRYADARPYLTPEEQPWLDEYVAALDRAKAKGVSKLEQAEAYWKAARVMREHGSALADYFDPVTMARRTSGREVELGDSSIISIKYGKPDKFVPPLAPAEQQRLKKNATPMLRRYYSTYLAADLAFRSAALMPDNDEKTARRLNRAGSWLKDGDEAAADRFYQAIERRCAKTELGKEAIKKHWFVNVAEEEESKN